MRKLFFLFALSFISHTLLFAQNKWEPFAGLHLSGSADLYYIGPSYSAGVLHTFGKKQKWSWAPELTYFNKSTKYDHSSTIGEKDRFLSFSVRSNFNYRVGRTPGKGFFVGAGIGFQKASDECWTITDNGTTKSKNVHYDAIRYGIITATFNSGYTFKLDKNKSLQVLVSAIGPHTANDYLGNYVEVISVISAGARFVL